MDKAAIRLSFVGQLALDGTVTVRYSPGNSYQAIELKRKGYFNAAVRGSRKKLRKVGGSFENERGEKKVKSKQIFAFLLCF